MGCGTYMRGQVFIESIVAIAFIVALVFLSSVTWSLTRKNLSPSAVRGDKGQNLRIEFESMSKGLLSQFKTEQVGQKHYVQIENEGVQICIKNCGKNLGDWIKKSW